MNDDRSLDLGRVVIAAGNQREATPGMPQDGPYPATIQEVADNFRDFAKVDGFAVVDLRDEGLVDRIAEALFDHAGFAIPYEINAAKYSWEEKARAVLRAIGGTS